MTGALVADLRFRRRHRRGDVRSREAKFLPLGEDRRRPLAIVTAATYRPVMTARQATGRVLSIGALATALAVAPLAAGTQAASTDSQAAQVAAERGAGLPNVNVVRVGHGRGEAPLKSYGADGQSTLLWFWAPHCPFCKAEAPKLLDFNRQHGAEIKVLGLGAQDDLDQAEGFVGETNTASLTMVWDRTGRSWVHYRVTNQPTVILLDANGKERKRWFRDFNSAEIVEAAR